MAQALRALPRYVVRGYEPDRPPKRWCEMGKRVLIVGNSDGIGLALTKRLIERGDHVLGVSRSDVASLGAQHRQHQLDITASGFYEKLCEFIAADQVIDVAVYCAGIGEPFGTSGVAADTDTIRVNFGGLADTVRAVLPGMRERKKGQIIGVSSIGDLASASAPAYGASKAGVTAYLRGLRRPLGALGVRVSVVRLGFVATKMAKSDFRPFMITPDAAASVLLNVVDQAPASKTHPWTMHVLTRILSPFMA